ncbi:hypothetical protein E4U59_006172 [Claviceps monticola]|nr:hypothetical protein E4U59_006172 [Claviceps monticola]
MYFPENVARGLRWLSGFLVSTVLLVSSPPSHEIPPQDEREPSHDQPPWPQQQHDDGVPASKNKDGNLVKELLSQCLRGPALPATSCRLGRHAQTVAGLTGPEVSGEMGTRVEVADERCAGHQGRIEAPQRGEAHEKALDVGYRHEDRCRVSVSML